jgi:hypothetical protein
MENLCLPGPPESIGKLIVDDTEAKTPIMENVKQKIETLLNSRLNSYMFIELDGMNVNKCSNLLIRTCL